MSAKIDERVVGMKINHEQFLKGTQESISALDNLKKALNFDGVGKNTNLSALSTGVDTVTQKFGALQVVALGALATIGSKAVDLGLQLAQNLGNSMVSSAKQGFSEYETQMNAIQTIMANTSAKGTTMGQVNEALAELNTYADKTIYNFSEMTRNIGTFTAAGVSLDTATAAIKGIANLAAVSGSNSQQASTAMYQLSQAMASGTVKLMDWNSVVNAGMGGEVFQTALKETARTHGIAVDQMIAENGSFRESLQEGWLTSAVLTDTLAKFTGDLSREQILSQGYTEAQADEILRLGTMANDAATKVKTFSQLLETLAEAQGSGWAQSFQIILGDFEEAKMLFTEISDRIGAIIGASADARNAQLQIWKDGDERGSGRTATIDALRNAFDALMSVVEPIKEAFSEIFPPKLGKTLLDISFALRDFTKGLILSENAQQNLKMVAKAVFQVLKFGIDIILGIGKVIGFLIGLAFDLAGAIFGLISPILTFVRNLIPIQEGAEETTSAVENFFNMLVTVGKFLTGWFVSGLQTLGEGFNNFLNDGTAVKRVNDFKEGLEGIAKTFAMVWNVLTKGDFTGNPFLAEDSKFVDNLFKIREVIVKVVDAFRAFGDGVAEAADRAGGFWAGVGATIKSVWEAIGPFVDSVVKFFQGIVKGLDLETVLATINTGVLIALAIGISKAIKKITDALGFTADFKKGLLEGLDGLTGVLEGYQKKLKADALLKIAAAILVLAGALWILSTIDPNRLIGAVTAMATSFGILLAGLAILDKINAEPSLKASVALSLIAVAVNILATAVAKMGQLDAEQLKSGLIGITTAMLVLLVAAQAMSMMEGDILKSSVALILMATALNIMAGAVALFGIMDPAVLEQGIGSVALILGGLVLAAALLEKYAPKMVMSAVGLMAMAAAINMLLIPILALGLLDPAVLSQGIGSVALILGGLTAAAFLLGKASAQMILSAVGLMAMAAALNMLVTPILILGVTPWEVVMQGLAGLALTLLLLVAAAMAMAGATVGVVGMVAMAAAILILAVALKLLSDVPIEGLAIALGVLLVGILALAVVSAILTPLIPVMGGLAAVIAILAVGALLLSASLVIAALGIMMLAPALMLLAGSVAVFGKMSDAIMAGVGPMMALGAALLIFGAGALVAGVGALVLGIGLIVLGAGLALIGAVGLIGAVALSAVVKAMMKLMEHVPGMLILGGTFATLGAGVLILGAGLAVLAVAAILIVVAFSMMIPMGALIMTSFALITMAIERLVPMADEIGIIGKAMGKLGDSTIKLADSGRTAASGLRAINTSLTTLAISSMVASNALRIMATVVVSSMASMQSQLVRGSAGFQRFAMAVLMSIAFMNAGLGSGFSQATAQARGMSGALGGQLVAGIQSSYGPVYNASVTLGSQMTAGMTRGLQNGSWKVSQMASTVAANALTSAKKTLGVASPSKEFEKVGMWSDEGLAKGLLKNMGTVENAAEETGRAALSAVQKSLMAAKNAVATDMTLNPVIMPVLDLSEVQKSASGLNGLLKTPTLTVTDSYAKASYISATRRSDEAQAAEEATDTTGTTVNFTQNNTSPKPLSTSEIYRNSKNAISLIKKEAPV